MYGYCTDLGGEDILPNINIGVPRPTRGKISNYTLIIILLGLFWSFGACAHMYIGVTLRSKQIYIEVEVHKINVLTIYICTCI